MGGGGPASMGGNPRQADDWSNAYYNNMFGLSGVPFYAQNAFSWMMPPQSFLSGLLGQPQAPSPNPAMGISPVEQPQPAAPMSIPTPPSAMPILTASMPASIAMPASAMPDTGSTYANPFLAGLFANAMRGQ
jgi:hypothetical protein